MQSNAFLFDLKATSQKGMHTSYCEHEQKSNMTGKSEALVSNLLVMLYQTEPQTDFQIIMFVSL